MMHFRGTKAAALLLLLLLLPGAAGQFSIAGGRARFYMSVSLTRGERSRDSHSSTTVITITDQRLTYDKTFKGYRRGGGQAVHREFQIGSEDVARLRQVIKANGLMKSNTLAFSSEEKGLYTYFDFQLNLKDGGRASLIKLSGPRRDEKIKTDSLYKNSDALLQELSNILHKLDGEIIFEGMVD